MSRKMIDYKVENGTITSIDGYEVGGGGTAVEANPQEEATQQLEKIKIDNISYNIAGGSSNERKLVINTNYSRTENISTEYSISEDIYQKLNSYYYDSVEFRYKDGGLIAKLTCVNYSLDGTNAPKKSYICVTRPDRYSNHTDWYGKEYYYSTTKIILNWYGGEGNRILQIFNIGDFKGIQLDKSKFDKLYKLADAPTEDGTYTLKCSVSGGVATYSWVKDA